MKSIRSNIFTTGHFDHCAFVERRSIYLLLCIISINLFFSKQTTAQEKEELSQFQLYSMVEKCQEQLRQFNFDLNVLKQDDVPNHFKDTTIANAQRRFALGGNTFVQSDLNDSYSYKNNNEVELSTYLIDYQIATGVEKVSMLLDSSEFTIPRRTTDREFIMYIGYGQRIHGLDSEGDSIGHQNRLALFQISIDSITSSVSTKIASITFLDPRKKPPFEKIPARDMETEFKAYRNKISAAPDSVFVYNTDLGESLLNEYKERSEQSKKEFEKTYREFTAFRNLGDYHNAAVKLIYAKNLNNWDPKIQEVTPQFQDEMQDEIGRLSSLTEQYVERWEYRGADSLVQINERLVDDFSDLFAFQNKLRSKVDNQRGKVEKLRKSWEFHEGQVSKNPDIDALKHKYLNFINNSPACSAGQLSDSSATVHFILGLIEEKSMIEGWKARAKGSYESALICKPDFSNARRKVIRLSADRSEKIKGFEELMVNNPFEPDYLYKLALLKSEVTEEWDEAIVLLEKALAIQPTNYRVMAKLAELYGKDGNYDKAIEKGLIVNEKSPSSRNSIFLTFFYLESAGSRSKDATKYEEYYAHVELSQQDLATLDSLAQTYIKEASYFTSTGQHEYAIEFYEKLFVLVNSQIMYSHVWIEAAKSYMSSEQVASNFERAQIFAEKAANDTNHKSPEAYLLWAQALSAAKKYDAADEKYVQLINLQAKPDYTSYFERGMNKLKEGFDYTLARSCFSSALKVASVPDQNSKEYNAYVKIGICWRSEQNYEESEKALEEALKIGRRNELSIANYEMGITLYAAKGEKNLRNAIKFLETASELGHKPYEAQHYIAKCNYKLGKYTHALETLNLINKNFPAEMTTEDRELRVKHFLIHFDEYENATEELRRIAKDDPEYVNTYDYLYLDGLRIILIELTSHKDEFDRLIFENTESQMNTAITQNQNRPEAYFVKSVSLFHQNDFEQCGENMKLALEKNYEYDLIDHKNELHEFFKNDQVKEAIKAGR